MVVYEGTNLVDKKHPSNQQESDNVNEAETAQSLLFFNETSGSSTSTTPPGRMLTEASIASPESAISSSGVSPLPLLSNSRPSSETIISTTLGNPKGVSASNEPNWNSDWKSPNLERVSLRTILNSSGGMNSPRRQSNPDDKNTVVVSQGNAQRLGIPQTDVSQQGMSAPLSPEIGMMVNNDDVLCEAEFTLGDSTYHALHDTLRDYMFSTAKLTTPSIAPNALGLDESAKRQADSILSDSTLSNIGQTRLLRNYVDEIASWVSWLHF
ncbi:hypothetical protein V1522DRAFT_42435 [Lipomyces starkeyi]